MIFMFLMLMLIEYTYGLPFYAIYICIIGLTWLFLSKAAALTIFIIFLLYLACSTYFSVNDKDRY